ncbi:MAG: flavodoxin family protein [Zhaonellaceae bacterium]|jgi:multimeric flavodoxin WrbA|nr:flavodoxin family protein [Clostridia bacterium]
MPKILGICGSPRKGATEYAVREALKSAEEIPGITTEFWSVRGKKISYCYQCDRCIKDKTMCFIQDDIKGLEELFLEADGFIIGSPVYDMNVSAQLAAVFNRLRPVYLVHPGVLKNKVGGALTTGGTRHGGQEMVLQAIVNFYLMHEILVTGGLGGCYNGGTIWSKDKKAQGAMEDTVGLDTVKRLGRGVAEAVMVSSFGREKWLQMAADLNIDIEGKSPLRDH